MPISSAGKTSRPPQGSQRGFTYVVLLAAVAVMGIMAGITTDLVSTTIANDKEAELLFRGQAYMQAIKNYQASRPAKQRQYPKQLTHLLNDPQYPNRRHIRRLYADPTTDQPWQIIRNAKGGIIGVASQNPRTPRKQANFPDQLIEFEGAESYRDWRFVYVPLVVR